VQTKIVQALMALAVLLSLAWWVSSPGEWEPVISTVLATVGFITIGRVSEGRSSTSPAELGGLVVLPLGGASRDDMDGSFGDVLTEEIVRSLAGIRSLRVIAATSSFRLRETKRDIRAIADELAVRYVLSGHLRLMGDTMSVSVELVDAVDSSQVWSNKYSGTVDHLLEMHEEIGRAIAEALKIELTPAEDEGFSERGIDDPRARQCFLRAQQEIYRLTEESLGKARQLLENGLSLVGPNEVLLAALGDVHFQLYNVAGADRVALREAEEYARRALDLNPDSATALCVMGLVTYKERADIPAAVRWLRRSLRSDPVNTTALFWLPYFLAHSGRASAARVFVEQLLDIDPLIPINQGVAGLVEVMDGRFAQAVPYYRLWHQMEPGHPFALWAYAYVLINAGKTADGEALLARLPTTSPPTVWDQLGMALRSGLQGDAAGVARQVTPEISALIKTHEQFSWHAARFYALAGMVDEALVALEDAMNLGFVNYPFIDRQDPFLENVRADARFADLMEEMRERWEAFEA